MAKIRRPIVVFEVTIEQDMVSDEELENMKSALSNKDFREALSNIAWEMFPWGDEVSVNVKLPRHILGDQWLGVRR